MANEPERPIETLLRAAAKKRRDEAGAPFELHPADRRLLQGEVARRFARSEREVHWFPQRLARLWPICVGALGILAVLGMAIWLLMPVPANERSAMSLAQNSPFGDTEAAKLPSSPFVADSAMTAPPPAPGVGGMPGGLASAEMPPPGRASEVRQFSGLPPQFPKDTTVAPGLHEGKEKLEPAAAPQLADQQKKVQMQLAAPSGTPASVPAGTGGGTYAARYGLAAKPPSPAVVPASPPAPPAVAQAPPAPSVALAEGLAKPADGKSDQPALQYESLATVASANRPVPAPAAMDALSQSAAGALKGAKTPAVTQRFVQAQPVANAQALLADKAKPAQAVLASFQLEQAGSQLRIVDGDGSVYSGYVQLEGAARLVRSARAEAPAAALAARAPARAPAQTTDSSLDSDRLAAQSYSFRVAGTNRSLNQKVVFTGDLLTATNLASSLSVATNLSPGGVVERYQTVPARQGPLPLLHSRISGKVVIGGGAAVEINALPASP